jgi:hypothetical protein
MPISDPDTRATMSASSATESVQPQADTSQFRYVLPSAGVLQEDLPVESRHMLPPFPEADRLRYTEFGGYYEDERIRELNAELVDDASA